MVDRYTGADPGSAVGGLTGRDVALIGLLARNATRHAIARDLRCSTATVDRHVARLRERYGVETSIEVVVQAVRDGVI